MTVTTTEGFMPASAEAPSDNQRLFVRYFTGTLIDLVVLNLFAEYWDKVTISTFTVSLLASVLLQVLLKLTVAIEHRVAQFFKRWSGALITFLRFFFDWLFHFVSIFVYLTVITLS